MQYSKVIEKFLRYVQIDTQSDEEATCFPSTEKQKNLGRLLTQELKDMGAKDVYFDEENCYVYAKIPATDESKTQTLAFISHMDTSPEISGKDVHPVIRENYDGKAIDLAGDGQYMLDPSYYPEILNYVGQDLITTDGTTLLGSDDKAGVAEIMTMAEILLSDSSRKHGEIAICFTPDEEVGAGVDHIDLERLGADYAYTVDGGALGELEYENFNAGSATVKVKGISVHPGDAKDKMKNASLLATAFAAALPEEETPAHTEGYEGFYHLTSMKGSIEDAELHYILRDHDRSKYEAKKVYLQELAKQMNEEEGGEFFTVEISDSYFNMREKIEPDFMFLIDRAKEAMEELGVTPVVQPIRGGTDGARLSFMGLPCPNLCTGGHNFHGRYEYACIQSMEKIVDLLVLLTEK